MRVLNRNLTGFQVNFGFLWPTIVVFPAFDLKTLTLVNCSAFRTIWSHKEYWIANQSLPNPSNKLRCRFSIKILSICVWILAVPWKTSSIKGFPIQIGFCLMFYRSSRQVVVSGTPWSISCTVTFLHDFSVVSPKSDLVNDVTWPYVIAIEQMCFSLVPKARCWNGWLVSQNLPQLCQITQTGVRGVYTVLLLNVRKCLLPDLQLKCLCNEKTRFLTAIVQVVNVQNQQKHTGVPCREGPLARVSRWHLEQRLWAPSP